MVSKLERIVLGWCISKSGLLTHKYCDRNINLSFPKRQGTHAITTSTNDAYMSMKFHEILMEKGIYEL